MVSMANMLSSDSYAAFVVGFAIMTDSMIYTLVLPFLPDLFTRRLGVSDRDVPQWTALSFEVFAVSTLLTNAVVGVLTDSSASRSRPFLFSVLIMVMSTILFFVGTTPAMIVISRAIQGASTTFTWVTGLAFLVAQVGEGDLGAYVGWTTVGVAVGEMIGPFVGGPIYDYLGHWAAFGVIEALLMVDILLRVFAKEKRREVNSDSHEEGDSEAGSTPNVEAEREGHSGTEGLLQDDSTTRANYGTSEREAKQPSSPRAVMKSLAWSWLGTILTLIIIFMVRGALEVAVPLYLIRQYSWTPTKISFTLFTITVPAALNPIVGRLTSRQGPRWWSTISFAVCGAALLTFGGVAGHSDTSKVLFILHLAVVGIALAVLVNANQVAMSVAAQRFGTATALAKNKNEELGRVLTWLSPSVMLSGVTSSWAAGILLGPAYSSLIAYTEDAGWSLFCRGLGILCFVGAIGSSFLWRKW